MPARKWVWASAREKAEEVQDAASLSPEGRGSMFNSAAITSALSLSGRVRRLTISFGQTCQKSPSRRSQSWRIAADERKSGVKGTRVSGRADQGGRRIIKNKNTRA